MIGARTRWRTRSSAPAQAAASHHATPADEAFRSVVEAARLNAAWAWESIYGTFAPHVYGWLRMEQPDLADDVLGETFLCVVRDIHEFRGGERAFRSWIFRIARNRLHDALRAQARRPQAAYGCPQDTLATEADPSPDAAERAMRSMQRARIADLLRVLPEDQRSIIYLRFVLDASVAEAAEALNVSVAAAKMLQQRALKTLAARMPAVLAG